MYHHICSIIDLSMSPVKSMGLLLENLKLPEYRSGYRSRCALRGHS